MSDRRLAILGSLLGLTLLVYAMVGVRVIYSGSPHYGALIWNVFPAWIPFVLGLAVYDGLRRGASPAPLILGGALWLLFFPNAAVHRHRPQAPSDLGRSSDLVRRRHGLAAAWADLALGFVSLYLMQTVVRRLVGAVDAWLFVFAVLALSSFGIYLGRFQRWNSWSVFTNPGRFARNVWPHLAQPHQHPKTVAVTLLFTVFLAATYLVFYSFARPSMFEASPTRDG